MKTKLTILIIGFLVFNKAMADKNHFQRKKVSQDYWGINVQMGGSSHGIALSLGAFYQMNKMLIVPQYQYNEHPDGNPNRFIETYSLMVGISTRDKYETYIPNRIKRVRKKSHVFSFYTGPGVMIYTTHGELKSSGGGLLSIWDDNQYEKHKYESLCWKVEFEYLISKDHFAFGIVPFANLNAHQNVFGLKLNWQYGRLR